MVTAKTFERPARFTTWRPWLSAAIAAVCLMAMAAYRAQHSRANLAPLPAQAELPPSGVGALGRLEPGWKVVRTAAGSGADGTRVEQLLVEEGQWVEENTLLAVLDTVARREAAVQEADAHVAACHAKLALIRVGAKPADIAAQEAFIAKYEAAVAHAGATLSRVDQLRRKQAATEEDFDLRTMEYKSNKALLEQARNVLEALRTVRPEDIAVAAAELKKAEATLARAIAERDAARITAPLSGRVLKIHARRGERVGESGLADLGDTNQMHAVAEVYERDAARVRVGQSARVKVQSLSGELTGEVVRVGWLIGRQEVFNNDPVRDTDARVVEVRVRLNAESAARVAGLTYARVEVGIDTAEAR